LVDYLKERTTDIDLLAVNTYAGGYITRKSGRLVVCPYMVTEWGPTGAWEGLHLLEIFNRRDK